MTMPVICSMFNSDWLVPLKAVIKYFEYHLEEQPLGHKLCTASPSLYITNSSSKWLNQLTPQLAV